MKRTKAQIMLNLYKKVTITLVKKQTTAQILSVAMI